MFFKSFTCINIYAKLSNDFYAVLEIELQDQKINCLFGSDFSDFVDFLEEEQQIKYEIISNDKKTCTKLSLNNDKVSINLYIKSTTNGKEMLVNVKHAKIDEFEKLMDRINDFKL